MLILLYIIYLSIDHSPGPSVFIEVICIFIRVCGSLTCSGQKNCFIDACKIFSLPSAACDVRGRGHFVSSIKVNTMMPEVG